LELLSNDILTNINDLELKKDQVENVVQSLENRSASFDKIASHVLGDCWSMPELDHSEEQMKDNVEDVDSTSCPLDCPRYERLFSGCIHVEEYRQLGFMKLLRLIIGCLNHHPPQRPTLLTLIDELQSIIDILHA
jgi:hypothetical protein